MSIKIKNVLEDVLLGIALIIIVVIIVILCTSCADEPRAGDECETYGEINCGTTCEETNQANICQVLQAVLWCDGYTWKTQEICGSGQMCNERYGYAECE